MKKRIDLHEFKDLFQCLNEMAFALALETPGIGAARQAAKAANKISLFLETLPNPTLGIISDCAFLQRHFEHLARPRSMFSPNPGTAQAIEAEKTMGRLREYLETLETAWRVCALGSEVPRRAIGSHY